MELRQLEHFVAVAKYLSFSRAARAVYIVQSSLSASIRRLERELGTPLFERTTHKVALTRAGSALLPIAQRVLMDVRTAREAVATVTAMLHGTVNIGTIQMLTWVDWPTALSKFHQAYPGVEISLHEAPVDELLDGLLAGDLDLAYIARDRRPLPEAITALTTRDEELVVVTALGHPLARHDQVSLTDLQHEAFIDFQAGSGLQTVIERLCQQAHLQRRITFRVTQLELLISLVGADLGIAILPAPIAERTELAYIRIALPRPHRTVSLVTRTPQPSNPVAIAFLNDFHNLGLR